MTAQALSTNIPRKSFYSSTVNFINVKKTTIATKAKLKNDPKPVKQLTDSIKSTVKEKVKAVIKQPLKNLKWLTDTSKTSLNLLAGINRPIAPGHVTKVATSIERLGCLQPIVVTEIDFINGKRMYYILDGQHKFTAMLRIGGEIPYVTIDIKDKTELVEAIALLNASSKSWSMHDYVIAWSSLKEDYVKLNRYYEIYDFEINILAQVLCNQSVSNGGSEMTKKIKKGDFTITNEKRAVEILNFMTDVLKVMPRMNRYENKYACSEYVKFLNSVGRDYKHEEFITKLSKRVDKFILATQEEGRLSDLFKKICLN
jgi:hypothetical protein